MNFLIHPSIYMYLQFVKCGSSSFTQLNIKPVNQLVHLKNPVNLCRSASLHHTNQEYDPNKWLYKKIWEKIKTYMDKFDAKCCDLARRKLESPLSENRRNNEKPFPLNETARLQAEMVNKRLGNYKQKITENLEKFRDINKIKECLMTGLCQVREYQLRIQNSRQYKAVKVTIIQQFCNVYDSIKFYYEHLKKARIERKKYLKKMRNLECPCDGKKSKDKVD